MENGFRADLSWLEDPQVFQVGRLDAHSDHCWFESEEDLKGKGRLIQSLNGEWKFAFSRRPADRPEEFYQETYDDSAFGTIQVPGHMETQGYGNIHYINTMYPWDGRSFLRPPHIDWEDDQVGSYVKEFDLEEALVGKRVCISFQGVEEAFYVWLNGKFIGYSEDSFTPSDFDLTDVVREKGNRLCVEVYKRSSAAWIEDQDFFRFSGIFREVYLYGKPKIHIEDLWAETGLKDDYNTGTFHLRVKVSAEKALSENHYSLSWMVKDREGNIAASGACRKLEAGEEWRQIEVAETEIPGVRRWSSPDPYLYELEVTLTGEDGSLIEIVPYSLGFRRFEIRDKIMLLNGERIIVNGVNRHEWNPRRGRSITEEDMRRDIEIIKRNNINAVRTSHYPNQSLWYRLCDENGIYVMDETNLESHGSWQKMSVCEPSWNVPASLPEWKECVVDRARSMVERDKNHACVLWWSCGNESYAGECILAISRYFHEKDPSRVVHYEGVYWNREFNEISDVESRMYAPPAEVKEYLENDPQKPFIMCEYMHDMGNSIGGMESYIRLLDEFPMYQGGFIWDYIDQAIYRKDIDGTEVLGYGGDFNDRPTDYAFSGNGIVFADRKEKPAMQEVRYWYSSPEERRKMDEENRRAAEEADAAISAEAISPAEADARPDAFQVIRGDVTLGIRGKGFAVLFSYAEHGPVSLVYGGTEWIYRPAYPAFWRGTTENDKGNGFPLRSAVWCGADQFIQCTGWNVREGSGWASITYEYQTCTEPSAQVLVTYTVDEQGVIRVKTRYRGTQGLPQFPVFGLRFTVPFPADRYQWQGLSGETYPDRKKGGAFGIWEETLKKPDYLVPQEYGSHVETRWVKLYKGQETLKITMAGGKPFCFSAIPYTPQELESAKHREELPEIRRTVVSVLTAMRGVGGIDSWGSDVEAEYHVSAEKDMEYEFTISGGK